MTLSDHPDHDERMYRDYLWDGEVGLEFSKIPTSLVGWGKKKPQEGNSPKVAYKGPSDPKEAHPSAPNPLLQLRPGGG